MLKIKTKRNEKSVKDSITAAGLAGFCQTKQEYDKLGQVLKKYKEKLGAKALEYLKKEAKNDKDLSTITLESGEYKVRIFFGVDVTVKDKQMLKEVLQDRFDDLVRVDVVFKPEDRLKNMAEDDEGILQCLNFRDKAPTFTVLK